MSLPAMTETAVYYVSTAATFSTLFVCVTAFLIVALIIDAKRRGK